MEDKNYYFFSYILEHGRYSTPVIMSEVSDMHPFLVLMEHKDNREEFEKNLNHGPSNRTIETIISFQKISKEEYLMFQNISKNKDKRTLINLY